MTSIATPFPRRPIPVVGESIYGFDRRFAACARFDRLGTFRSATGLLDIGPRSVAAKFERLATLAGGSASALDHMRWSPKVSSSGFTAVDLLGHQVREVYLRSDRLRICPACLDEDGPAEQRIHRQAWQILQVCACPRHRSLLLEECDACREPLRQIRKTKVWSCACGREMTAMEAPPAPVGAIAMSLTFMRHFGATSGALPDDAVELPEPFDRMPLDDLLTVAARLGSPASTSASADEPTTSTTKVYHQRAAFDYQITVGQAALSMDAAYRIIKDWPASADRFFSDIADRNPLPATAHMVRRIFATRVGYQLLEPMKSIDGSDIGVVHDALRDWLHRVRGIYLDGRQRAKVAVDGETHIDVADAMRRLEGRTVNPLSIKAWIGAGAVDVAVGKVSLSSVNRTLASLAALEEQEFDDPIGIHEWSGPRIYSTSFRRSDALRALLAGAIRIRRDQDDGRHGLSSLKICRTDLLFLIAQAVPSSVGRLPKARETPAMARVRRLTRRIGQARENDMFTYPKRVQEIISQMWPGVVPIDVTLPLVRCKYVVATFGGRRCPRREYSVLDAIEVMSDIYGPSLALSL